MGPPTFRSAPLQLQPRDIALLCGLFESRIMTAVHISHLYFDGSREAAKKRLRKIKSAGLVAERKRRVNEPAILFLTRKAFNVLQQCGAVSVYPHLGSTSFEKRVPVGELTLRHELEVMNVKAIFHSRLTKAEKVQLAEFSTWPALYQFRASRPSLGKEVDVKPDGFIRIHEREADGTLSEHSFFLEVDRSSETQDTLVNRAGCYLDYYQSGGFAVWNGGNRMDFKEYPFRVLMVFKNDERRNNTAQRLLQHNPPILTQVYLTTMSEVLANPLGAIWVRPLDYRKATEGTGFDPYRPRATWTYRRQPARELLVAQSITKVGLLTSDARP